MKITNEHRKIILSSYKEKTRDELCQETGLTSKQITGVLYNRGLTISDEFTEAEIKKIIEFYSNKEIIDLKSFSHEIDRQATSICRVARRLGLTKIGRPANEESKIKISEKTRSWIRENGHPRGMLNKRHTDGMRKKMSDRLVSSWADENSIFNSDKHRQKKSDVMCGKRASNSSYSRGRSGTRGDLGFFVRSSWEANYARYLKFLQKNGEIVRFEYEPDTYIFHEIKRGTRSYTPDFKIFLNDGSFEYHEVKGWMDNKSRVKLERMKKFYPNIRVILIEKKEYNEIKKISSMIEFWE